MNFSSSKISCHKYYSFNKYKRSTDRQLSKKYWKMINDKWHWWIKHGISVLIIIQLRFIPSILYGSLRRQRFKGLIGSIRFDAAFCICYVFDAVIITIRKKCSRICIKRVVYINLDNRQFSGSDDNISISYSTRRQEKTVCGKCCWDFKTF